MAFSLIGISLILLVIVGIAGLVFSLRESRDGGDEAARWPDPTER